LIDAVTTSLASASDAIQFNDLGLHPVLFEWGWFQLRWYSLAYLFGIIIGWWYLLKLIRQPGAPMARRHADDMAFYATLGIILGGRLGYVFFYKPVEYFQNPVEIFKLWDGGMSFHGGVIGVSLGIIYSPGGGSSTGSGSTITSPAASRPACSSVASPIS
jgi:phosphatidylglycerol:prolipoprotein diacylglycerol transferase